MTLFLDSNIPMYLVGGPHPHKADSQRLLQQFVTAAERLVTDAEVLQEILHRYDALGRRDAIEPAFQALLGLAAEVFPIEAADVRRAKEILLRTGGLSARDSVHLAVMERQGVRRILSFDTAFDSYPGVVRLS